MVDSPILQHPGTVAHVRQGADSVEGVLAIRKESGPTSHDVVAQVRRILGQRRVGHCGTLDPIATGVLVLCVGRFTRLAEFFSDADKEYGTTLRLGATSDTYDAQGQIRVWDAARVPTAQAVHAAVERFVGSGSQVPPAFSAVKIHGVRSYKLARGGHQVELEPRSITIHDIRVIGYLYPELHLSVWCSKGTYIRSLAHDLGRILGCGAYVQELCRTRVGAVAEVDAITLSELVRAARRDAVRELMIPVRKALPGLPHLVLDGDALQRFAAGNTIRMSVPVPPAKACLVGDRHGRFWGVGQADADSTALRPRKVMIPCDAAAEHPG